MCFPSNPVKARHAVSNESVGWDQPFKSGGEFIDALDRQDANSSGPILNELGYKMMMEGMPL